MKESGHTNKQNNKYRGCDYLVEKVCPICGKKMVRLYWGDYAYKIGIKVFCSYTCMRKYENRKSCDNNL